jgi:mRNA interferase HicA
MKRRDLLRHLSQYGCQLLREGGEHSIWENPTNNRRTSYPAPQRNCGLYSSKNL